MKGKGIFITATGTEVGKTFITCGLASMLRARGIDAGVMKPFASGGLLENNGYLINEDVKRLMLAAPSKDSIVEINPYNFKAPLAPLIAAKQEGKTISLKKVFSAYQALSARHDLMLVEGVGGAAVPVWGKTDAADIAAQLKLPCIVVVSSKLGTLNHTFLTLQHLRAKKIKLLGIILNFYDNSSLTDRTNLEFFKQRKVPILATIPENNVWQTNFKALSQHLLDQKLDSLLNRLIFPVKNKKRMF